MTVADQSSENRVSLYRPSSPRPRSPYVTIYHWSVTMAMSIAHRVTGIVLYAGTVFLVIYLAALAMGERSFIYMQAVYLSPIGRIILFLYSLALIHHMIGGIRHLFWDVNPDLLEKHCATKVAWATIFISFILTLLVWIIAYTWF